jgi:hypothetical protein
MTTRRVYTPKETQQLLSWIKGTNPRAYAGLVRRFTPNDRAQVAGIWDTIANAASSITSGVTTFLNSEGTQKLFNAAQPFLQSELEKKQLKLNLQRMQAGLPLQQYPTGAGSSVLPFGTDPLLWEQQQQQRDIPWPWIIGGAGLVLLLVMRRPNG